jgi:hypothetical protein
VNQALSQRKMIFSYPRRKQFWLMGVSLVPGVTWGLLGVLFGSRVLHLFVDGNQRLDGRLEAFGIIIGMMLGVPAASSGWLRKPRIQIKVLPRFVQVFGLCMRCVIYGALIGSTIAVMFYNPGFLAFAVPYGLAMSLFTVFPVAPLMAPLTILVWEKTLVWLESRERQHSNQP